MHSSLLHDIGICVLSATALAFAARLLRQPLILAYIGAGLVIGPMGLRWIRDEAAIAQISELGLAFLLFIVGLEIDLKALGRAGRSAVLVGTVQVVACSLLGWGAAWLIGLRGLPAAYFAVAGAFSSTMIVVKLLSDKYQLDSVAGRLTLGVLLVQDVLAILVLAVQANVSNPSLGAIALSQAKGVGLVAASLLASRYVLPPLFRSVAKHPEVVLIAAISWCFLVSGVALAAGFSIAMGALVAGVSISTFPYSLDVVARIRSLRDFFVTLFFVSLGMQIRLGSGSVLAAAGVLSAVVLLGRFLPVIPSLRAVGYGHRVGLLVSIHLSQVSEFSLVICSLGLALGHVDASMVSVVAIALVVTSTASTYLIQWDHAIAGRVSRLLSRAGHPEREERESRAARHGAARIVILGCHRVASSLVPLLAEDGEDFLVVDFNPEVRRRLEEMNVRCLYGDISHADTLEHAGVAQAKVLLLTISDDFLRGTSNLVLVRTLRRLNPGAVIITRAERLAAAREMYAAGADYVILPRHVMAEQVLDLLRRIESGTLDQARTAELEALDHRKEVVA